MSRFARISTRSALTVLAMTAAFTLTAADARTAKPDNYVAVGAPVDCLQLSSIRSSRVLDDKTIDFETDNRTVYRNTLPYACPGLKSEERFGYKTSLDRLCSVDIINVLRDFGGGLMPGASCGLGQFQKMQKAGK